jgi:hypothetical protein
LLWIIACTAVYVWPAVTLARFHVTAVVVGTAKVTFTRLTTFMIIRQPPIFRQTLVTITTNYVAFTSAFTADHIAALIVDGTESIAGTC